MGLVSVIIPTYNRAKLLMEAVLSVFNQTYRPIECIVVDDGSSDSTSLLLKDLERLNHGGFVLKYITQQNRGAQVARNTGTTACIGEYIQYLDSDDILFPEKLEKQVQYLKVHQSCDGVFGDWQIGNVNKSEYVLGFASKDMITQFLTGRCISAFSFLMRRRIVMAIGDWDPMIRRNQEIDFHVRGLLIEGKFEYLPGITGLWRIHDEERIGNSTGLQDILFFYQKMERLLKAQNLFTVEIKRRLSELYVWFLSQYQNSPDAELIMLMEAAVRLNPDIGFMKSKKLRFLRNVAGDKLAYRFWLYKFRQVNKVTV